MFLEEIEEDVDQQHRQDDAEVVPLAHRRREHGGQLDHPRDRAPEAATDPVQERLFMGGDFVRTEFAQSSRGFVLAQAAGGGCGEILERLLDALLGKGVCAFHAYFRR